MNNTEEVKVNESVQRVADAISSYLNEKQNVKLDEWTVSDVEIAMKKKYGKVDKEAIEKLKKVQYKGNVDRNDLVKVGHGKLHVESVDLDEVSKLPPHLAKLFDKDGNLKKDAADKIAKGKEKLNWKDVTPKGYGPKEEVELDESLGLQMKMAFDDAKIKVKGAKGGKLVIAKKDKKKATAVLSKSLKKGSNVNKVIDKMIVFEEVEDQVDPNPEKTISKVFSHIKTLMKNEKIV